MKLNYEYAAVIMEGKLRLHKVRKHLKNKQVKIVQIVEHEGDQTATFPEPSRNAGLLAADLTDNFLIFSTDVILVYFLRTVFLI